MATWYTLNQNILVHTEPVHCVPTIDYSANVLFRSDIMARKKRERKVGKTSSKEMRRGLLLIRGGSSIREAAHTAGIPYPTLRRYWIQSNQAPESMTYVPQYEINRVFSEEQENALKE
ncbi:hypothetical protein NQ315_006093 [Exocentrus adspersus]|uniref:HTH psq-type domain-containing protein n=1 Tax=Exocentrus adspersus TaxID=1586481 RepID=A0AAV8VEJ1_9CUCU|nr:hypothetical protein NQ315_006093 [Exocentrus adspersus]